MWNQGTPKSSSRQSCRRGHLVTNGCGILAIKRGCSIITSNCLPCSHHDPNVTAVSPECSPLDRGQLHLKLWAAWSGPRHWNSSCVGACWGRTDTLCVPAAATPSKETHSVGNLTDHWREIRCQPARFAATYSDRHPIEQQCACKVQWVNAWQWLVESYCILTEFSRGWSLREIRCTFYSSPSGEL